MKRYKRFLSSLVSALERSGRARTLSVLQDMDSRLLSEAGFSPELIRQGINAWPWRAETSNPPKVSYEQAGSREVAGNTDQLVCGSQDNFGHDRIVSSDAPAIPERIDNGVAA